MKTFSLYALVEVDEYVDPAHKYPEGALCAAGGFYPPLQGVAKTIGLQQPTGHTPSVSPFGLPAPSEREPRALRACGRMRAPTYPYKTRSVIKNLRFLCCPSPGGSGNPRIRTKFVA